MNSQISPYKWAGGKSWIGRKYQNLLQLSSKRLVEPFAGSAAIFFYYQPTSAWLNDINLELIDSYRQIRDNWDVLYSIILQYELEHNEAFYYAMRDHQPSTGLERAARFIYLNRTCFNGIYRVNQKGQFNVPIGTKSVTLPTDNFELTAESLSKVKLTSLDFENVIDECGTNDFLFVDPPYTVQHNMNGFVKYNEKIFAWSDQIRLRDSVFRARKRGADVVVCNADHQSVRDLYALADATLILHRSSVIAANPGSRGRTTEVAFRI